MNKSGFVYMALALNALILFMNLLLGYQCFAAINLACILLLVIQVQISELIKSDEDKNESE